MIMNVSRHSTSEADFDNYFVPIIPVLSMFVNMRSAPGGSEKLESVSHVLIRLSESFMRFYSPHS